MENNDFTYIHSFTYENNYNENNILEIVESNLANLDDILWNRRNGISKEFWNRN